jgi:hypothetical protein
MNVPSSPAFIDPTCRYTPQRVIAAPESQVPVWLDQPRAQRCAPEPSATLRRTRAICIRRCAQLVRQPYECALIRHALPDASHHGADCAPRTRPPRDKRPEATPGSNGIRRGRRCDPGAALLLRTHPPAAGPLLLRARSMPDALDRAFRQSLCPPPDDSA